MSDPPTDNPPTATRLADRIARMSTPALISILCIAGGLLSLPLLRFVADDWHPHVILGAQSVAVFLGGRFLPAEVSPVSADETRS